MAQANLYVAIRRGEAAILKLNYNAGTMIAESVIAAGNFNKIDLTIAEQEYLDLENGVTRLTDDHPVVVYDGRITFAEEWHSEIYQ